MTGAHSMKVGYQGNRLDQLDQTIANQTAARLPLQPGRAERRQLPAARLRPSHASRTCTASSSRTAGRAAGSTLQGALRYDRASSYAPVEQNGTTQTSFLNPAPITIAKTPGVDAYNDITPRIGVAYDVFGNGKTALKFNWGHYLAYAANDPPYTSTNPGFTVVREVQNRHWTDSNRELRRRLRPAA